MSDRSRLVLAACLVVLAIGLVVALASIREITPPAQPEPPPPPPPPSGPEAGEPAGDSSPPPPVPTRPLPPEPTRAETEALALRLVAREPALEGVALPALLWHFDRLAEALGAEERPPTGGGDPCTLAEGTLLTDGLGPLGREAVPGLIALLTSRVRRGDASIARAAALALGGQDVPPIERVHEYFVHARDPHLRQHLVLAATSMTPATPEVLTLLAAACRDPQPWVSGLALGRLAALGPEAEAVLPTIRPLLEAELEGTRLLAAGAVLRIQGPDAKAHEVIEAQLTSIDPFDRGQALEAVASLGEAGRGVWPALLPLLGDARFALPKLEGQEPPPDTVSWATSAALVLLDARALEEGLLGVVRGDDPQARVSAGLALVGMGIPFAEAPVVLAEALALETKSTWLERTRLTRIADDLEPALVDDGLLDALTTHLHGLYGKEAGRALLHLGTRGMARVKALLAEHDASHEFERYAILSALQDEPALGRGLRAELATMADADSNAWNRDTARELLEAIADD